MSTYQLVQGHGSPYLILTFNGFSVIYSRVNSTVVGQGTP